MPRGGHRTAQPGKGKIGKTSQAKEPKEPEQPDTQASNASIDAAAESEIPEIRRSQIRTSAAKYLDESLPPMERLEDIFQDFVDKALSLGFADVLRRLGNRPLRVATVCSGTESPLLALEMITEGTYQDSC